MTGQSQLLQGLASIATGGGAAAAILFIIDLAIKAREFISGTTKAIQELEGEIQNLTQTTGPELTAYTAQIKALSDTFNVDNNELLNAANALTQNLTGDFATSLELIEKGYLAGADASGQYLDILKEYSPVFKEARLNGDQFIATITQQVRDGIFTDKGIDAIKEALLRLRELPPATREAIDAIGLQSAEIESLIEERGVGAAIQVISQRISELRDDAPEVGQALADIFGGPGEDAGLAFIESLSDINRSTDELIDKTNDLTRLQIKQLEANNRLANSQVALKEANNELSLSFAGLGTRLEAFGTDFLTLVTVSLQSNNIIQSIRKFRDLKREVNDAAEAYQGAKVSVDEFNQTETQDTGNNDQQIESIDKLRERQSLLKEEITSLRLANKDYTDQLEEYNEVTKRITEATSVFSKASNDANQTQVTLLGQLQERQSSLKDEIIDLRLANEDYTAQLEEYNQVTARITEATQVFAQTGVEAAEGSIGFLNTRIAELKKEIQESGDENAVADKVRELVGLEDQVKGLEDRIRALQERLREGDFGVVDQIGGRQGGDDLVLDNLQQQADKEIEITKQKNQRIAELERQAQEERRAIIQQGIQFAFDGFAEIAAAAVEIRRNRVDEERQIALDALDEEYERRFESVEGNAEAEAQLEAEFRQREKEIEKKAQEDQRKAAITQARINTALAIGNALATVQPFIPAGIAAAALAGIRGLAQEAVIKSQSFAGGGFTGKGFGVPDHTGHVPVGIVHADEYVSPKRVIESPSARPHLAALEKIRLNMGYPRNPATRMFADGGFTSDAASRPNGAPASRPVVVSGERSLSEDDVVRIASAVRDGSAQGTYDGSRQGLSDAQKVQSRKTSFNEKLEN